MVDLKSPAFRKTYKVSKEALAATERHMSIDMQSDVVAEALTYAGVIEDSYEIRLLFSDILEKRKPKTRNRSVAHVIAIALTKKNLIINKERSNV